ncbi:MAG: hypothetical protein JO051_02830 [Acidobacteriaceae bacterium]|nr:hypothetical protein [Acidobacteriaceae bacterium]
MADQDSLALLHYQLIQGVMQHGKCPSNLELAQSLKTSEAEIESLLSDLAAIHGVVLHPHVREPWIIHPFSLTPTLNWIEGETGSWWAPCVWCALGITTLVGGATRIHTRYGAEAEPRVIEVLDGRPLASDVVVHFAIPPARAWDNVHQHCSLVLPFRSPSAVQDWCTRYGVPMGEVVPLVTVSKLAQAWYGSHADRHWRKWSVEEAQDIFSRVGLNSEFWQLARGEGAF